MHDGQAQQWLRICSTIDRNLFQCIPRRLGIEIRLSAEVRHPRPQRIRNGDGITAKPKRHRRNGRCGEWRQTEIADDRHRRQNVRHLEMADRQSIADVRPRRLPHEREIDAFRLHEAFLLGSHEHGTVEQRHEPRSDLVFARHDQLSSGGARSPAAVIKLWAISEILRFWFMAVLRKSA